MRADRLLSILLLLQTRGRMTAAALAERLEVSLRTIYRDLDALSAAGVPVYAQPGPNGGCLLRSGYRTDLTGLSDAEVAALFAATAGRVLNDIGLESGVRGALLKLEAALPSAQRADAARVRARLHVDAAAWFAPNERTPQLAALREAVFADRRIELTYQRDDGRRATRRVDPLGLVVKGGMWYLVALAAGAQRVFRVARVRNVRVTAESFERPRGFDLAGFWTRWASDFVARIPQYVVQLHVARRALHVLPQIFGERARAAIDAAGPQCREHLRIDLTFDSLEAACTHLLGLGTLVEVVAPAELRAALRDRARATARHYGGATERARRSP